MLFEEEMGNLVPPMEKYTHEFCYMLKLYSPISSTARSYEGGVYPVRDARHNFAGC